MLSRIFSISMVFLSAVTAVELDSNQSDGAIDDSKYVNI